MPNECPICFEDYVYPDTADEDDASGERSDGEEVGGRRKHRMVALKRCGHVFGEHCVLRWIRSEGHCPLCMHVAKVREVLVLYPNANPNKDNFGGEEEDEGTDLEVAKLRSEVDAIQAERVKDRVKIDELAAELKEKKTELTKTKRASTTAKNRLKSAEETIARMRRATQRGKKVETGARKGAKKTAKGAKGK